jgi:hypothetical protein
MPTKPKGINGPDTMTVSIRCPAQAELQGVLRASICKRSAARVIGAPGKLILDAPFANLVHLSDRERFKVPAAHLVGQLFEGGIVSPLGPIDQPRLDVWTQPADFRDDGGKSHDQLLGGGLVLTCAIQHGPRPDDLKMGDGLRDLPWVFALHYL